MSNRGSTFLLVGNGPFANRGCEAIVRGTTHILSQRWPDAEYVLSSFGGDGALVDARSEADRRIRHVPHKDYWYRRFDSDWWRFRMLHRMSHTWQQAALFRAEFLAGMHAMCALQIGGDNYSLDYGEPSMHMNLDRVLSSIDVPLVLWGASVGPFSRDATMEAQMARHLGLFRLILARESSTVDYLNGLGLGDRVRLVADPAFMLEPSCPDLPSHLMQFLARRPMGLNLSPLLGRYLSSDQGVWESLADQCFQALASAGIGPILLIPHVMQTGNDDHDFMGALLRRAGGPTRDLQLAPAGLCAAEYKWLISQLSVFVGARTHATIASLSSCVPTASIAYSMKASGINQDVFGSSEWLIPLDEMTPARMLGVTKDLLRSESRLRTDLAAIIPEMKQRASLAAEYLAIGLGCSPADGGPCEQTASRSRRGGSDRSYGGST